MLPTLSENQNKLHSRAKEYLKSSPNKVCFGFFELYLACSKIETHETAMHDWAKIGKYN